MKEFNSQQLIELFEGKDSMDPETSENIPVEEDVFTPPFVQNVEPNFVPKKKRKKNQRPFRKNGVWALPAYKTTYDTYKECEFRFRKCNNDTKHICRQVTSNLKQMMVNIELYHWEVKPKEILTPTLELAMETVVIIRTLKDFGAITNKDFALICRNSSQMLVHMMKWNHHYNASVRRTEDSNRIL